MNAKNSNEPKFEIRRYDGKEVSVQTVTREEARAINPQSADHYFDLVHDVLAFRTATGEWVEHDWKLIGDVCLDILRALQLNAGEYLTPSDLAQLTGHGSLHNSNKNNNVSARLSALRRAHGENHKSPHFFRTRRGGGMAVAWAGERTWMWLERITPEDAGAASNEAA